MNAQISKYIHLSKYSRYLDELERRETWEESVQRLTDFWLKECPDIPPEDIEEVGRAIKEKHVMPSMRSLMTAGPALERDNVAGFNCAAIAINHPRVFDEIFYLLMCGCGVGYSVERKYIEKLPEVAEEIHETDTVIRVRDSKIGWATGLKALLSLLYAGELPSWDLGRIRPAGSRLKTFGGRASGPAPLDDLYRYTVHLFQKARGRRLNSLECHDLVCKIADTVIVGSVRRSACISLSNLTDKRMREAKMGSWYDHHPERALANNSVAYTEKPDMDAYLEELTAIHLSKAGERGIVNKEALRGKAEGCGREHNGDYLLNPCGEAILRDTGGLCNLTEVIVRPGDTLEQLEEKVRWATILGTLQSTLSNFRYLRAVWQKNQEEERLLGVSFTGVMDHVVMSGRSYDKGDSLEYWLQHLKQVAMDTNELWAHRLGIPKSKQLTLVKPSGTVSQLCGTSAGMHPRYAERYLRRYTQDIKDPLTALMVDEGIPHVTKGEKVIFTFPVEAPIDSVTVTDIDPIQQLKLWKIYREHWCDGNPSQTIYYDSDSFMCIAAWVYKNWDIVGGLSFFPKTDDIVYDPDTLPYKECTNKEYDEVLYNFPKDINWERLAEFEHEDATGMNHELACAGGNCEI